MIKSHHFPYFNLCMYNSSNEYTLTLFQANIFAVSFSFPFFLILYLPVRFMWSAKILAEGEEAFFNFLPWIIIVGIVGHELIHGITWMAFLKKDLRAIKFGVKRLTPYCHCKIPISVRNYRRGIFMPFYILGILPWSIALFTGSGFCLCFGILFSIMAIGDIIGLFMLRNLDKNELVIDHPNKIGFIIHNLENIKIDNQEIL